MRTMMLAMVAAVCIGTAGVLAQWPPVRSASVPRAADGMKRAWDTTQKTPIVAEDVSWKIERVALPPATYLREETLREFNRVLAEGGRLSLWNEPVEET